MISFLEENFGKEEKKLRIIITEKDSWFCSKDICDLIGYSNNRQAIRSASIDDKHKKSYGQIVVNKPERKYNLCKSTVFLNEFGFLSLVLKSSLPSAKKFQDWVHEEVLPELKKQYYSKLLEIARLENDFLDVPPGNGIVYVIHCQGTSFYKIGKTANMETRLRILQTGCPFKLKIIITMKNKEYHALEKGLHHFFAKKRREGEWFLLEDSDLGALKKTKEIWDEEESYELYIDHLTEIYNE